MNNQMLQSAKLIGAGTASVALAGVGVGVGLVFAAYIQGVSRNPSLQKQLFGITILGFALVEAAGLFALMMGFLKLLEYMQQILILLQLQLPLKLLKLYLHQLTLQIVTFGCSC